HPGGFTPTVGYSPCVRHGGGEHGLAGFMPGNTQWDDTWEHWKRRCLIAEAALLAEREACATLMLSLPCDGENVDPMFHAGYRAACQYGAAALRARAEEGQ